MNNAMVSVIIPSRDEPYLVKTMEDVLAHATGEIEVLVIVDGGSYPPFPHPMDKRVNILYHSVPMGTRRSINQATKIAKGKYLFKLDAHCGVSESFDEILVRDHQENWLVTLSRYSLDPELWTHRYGPISYEYIAYPLGSEHLGGLTPKKWIGETGIGTNMGKKEYFWIENQKKDILIDEIQTCNASCWFLTKDLFWQWDGFDERYWSFHNDGVEIGFKAWLSGGAMMVNKNAWHSHWFKPIEARKSVPLKRRTMWNMQAYSTWYWINNQWPKQTRTFRWFVDHFWPIPGWPEDWEERFRQIQPPQLREAPP